jgi:hypothetical protein
MKRAIHAAKAVVPAVLLSLATSAAAADSIKIGNKIPYAGPDVAREAIRKECDLENQMAAFLSAAVKGAEQTDNLKKAGGKVFDGKITGVWAAGGPWGAASILVEGQLREKGKVIGTVAARRNTTRGGGACSKLSVSARAIAKDIAGWIESPSMGAKLGDAK